jgi:arsenate reductase (thioredoxin)
MDPAPSATPHRVLFVCTHNSARSQMAEGFLRHVGGVRFDVSSAGTEPGRLRPEAVAVMRELGIDISEQWSKGVDVFLGESFDRVVTVCDEARESCPVFPGATGTSHWDFEDPSAVEGDQERRMAVFRRVRDEIGVAVRRFVAEVGDQPPM